ncbi:hypothetical protein L249_0726 [Ophiocordyceps polyrhachis-furcata BCC 54312]|uniref:Aminoglycoside phosphotransferase domain-containing protein n=1 Tax=Ophiocordyceps polyrhachis-furcata BCC 54312 TaxID=1330021 RepID=A0A367LED0_9HYPO|nr:hypothetical protein L249_0726 [Ophiocordyceps polyrhachis-furcata BCC 54312]
MVKSSLLISGPIQFDSTFTPVCYEIGVAPEMADRPIKLWTNHEREYHIYPDRFYKRSLRPSEYQLDVRGDPYVPPLGYQRLQNEAACLKFIRANTNIPVPEVLEAYDDNGSFVLITQRLFGVPMSQLPLDSQAIVVKEVERHLQSLRTLRSNRTGGPSGILCPPPRATQYFPGDTAWSAADVPGPGFNLVFCHCDLSQSNIIVHPLTLKIEGIIDWEYGGYWPDFFETQYFRDPRPSGAQFRNHSENARLEDSFVLKHVK